MKVSTRVAMALASAHPEAEEMEQWFEDGRLPCSFSQKLLWAPLLDQLDHLDQILADKRTRFADTQQKRENASQAVQSTQQEMEKLRVQLDTLQKKEAILVEREKHLQAQLQDFQELDVVALRPFVQLAAQVEQKLVCQLEAKLVEDKESLIPLSEKGGPKMSLLLNCFGAEAETIKVLRDVSSSEMLSYAERDVDRMVWALPKHQQIAVLYTRERLKEGKLPYAEHNCALCVCETAKQMARFLNANGLKKVTAETIQQTGAYGRGALLFLSVQDLQLKPKDQKALMMSRQVHRKSAN